jgi:hypothetical protein
MVFVVQYNGNFTITKVTKMLTTAHLITRYFQKKAAMNITIHRRHFIYNGDGFCLTRHVPHFAGGKPAYHFF